VSDKVSDIFSGELKNIAWYSYNLSLTSDKMSAVNLLSELLDVRARRLEICGYNINEEKKERKIYLPRTITVSNKKNKNKNKKNNIEVSS